METYRTRKAVYDTELVQAKNVHAVITAQTKQIKSDYEIKLKPVSYTHLDVYKRQVYIFLKNQLEKTKQIIR